MLRAEARVNDAAIERNVARLARELAGGTELCAVVKADGYGHGAVAAARAALAGGARWLAVATAQEAAQLRAQGIAARLLVMGAMTAEELAVALQADADVVAWDERFVGWLGGRPARVHVKLDTGMGRLGADDAVCADRVVAAVRDAAGAHLAGAMTHFATADEPGDSYFGEQLERFRAWSEPLKREDSAVVVHAANSAALLRDRASHFDLVRPGIAIYGLDPYGGDAGQRELEPALELRSWVAAIKPLAAGQSAGYGRAFVAAATTRIATVPIGYGDGVRRALSGNGEAVIGGLRYPIVGRVSMDNLALDLGADRAEVSVGDPVVLIGEGLTAEAMAQRIETINYEITCGIGARVPRVHHRDGAPSP